MADEPAPDEALVEQIRQLRVEDLLLSSMATIAQLAYAKLDAESRDLDDARLAIESLRALLPVVESNLSEDAARDFRQVVANLQLVYAEASG